MAQRTAVLGAGLSLALLLALVAADEQVSSIKFVTCPACRLNHLPEVKRFIRGEVEPGHYGPSVTVEFIPGHNPEAVFFNASDQQMYKMRVDHMSFSDLVELVTSRGFKRDASLGPLPEDPATAASGEGGVQRRRLLTRLVRS